MKKYVTSSLKLHLFFGRIMKEHALFLTASFPAIETNFIKQSDWYREQFELLLKEVVNLANGKVSGDVLSSGEVVTEFTELAERQTRKLSGIAIDIQITQAEKRLHAGCMNRPDRETIMHVRNINQRTIRLLNGLISLKEMILREVVSCHLYTTNYPLLIAHILREAKWYRSSVINLERGNGMPAKDKVIESFWNQIMMEHAEFIRGLLDPTECDLINTADEFAKEYCELLEMAKQQDCKVQEELTGRALELTERYQNFKASGAEGITGCKIRSIIIPLLADHVLREANHYLRILRNEEGERKVVYDTKA